MVKLMMQRSVTAMEVIIGKLEKYSGFSSHIFPFKFANDSRVGNGMMNLILVILSFYFF